MKITWKDGITTLSTAGAIVLERAYFHSWDLPLISNIDWAIAGLVGLTAVGFLFSYALDKFRSVGWSTIAGVLGMAAVVFAALGLYTHNTDYVVLLMLNAVAFWAASIIRHVTVNMPAVYTHA